jgi:hypothetical protein
MLSYETHQAAVHEIANEIDALVMDATIRARFTAHIDRLCKMVEDYGQALQGYAQQLEEAKQRIEQDSSIIQPKPGKGISLVDICPPPKDWVSMGYEDNLFINVDLSVIYRPAEPVNPLLWFGLFGSAGLQRKPEDSEKIICEYVRLAVIHDYELRYSGTPSDSYIFSAEYEGKWFQRNKFCEDVWAYYHYYNQNPDLIHYPATAQEKLSHLNRALGHVQADLARGPTGRIESRCNMDLLNQNLAAIGDILAAVEKWKIIADHDNPDSKESRQCGSKALELLCEHVKILDDFQRYFGAGVVTQGVIYWLKEIAVLYFCSGQTLEIKNIGGGGDHFAVVRDDFITDLKRWIEEAKAQPGEQESTEASGGETKSDGVLKPKPPEILQEILWVWKYGRKYWWVILLAILVTLFLTILHRFI